MLFIRFCSFITWYLRPFLKWFLRKTTHYCELQRICYGERPGAARCVAVEESLNLSRTRQIKEIITNLDTIVIERNIHLSNIDEFLNSAVNIITKVKGINPKIHGRFTISFKRCLEQIWSYKHLINEVENLRKIQYESEDIDHERKLILLWTLLMPNEKLENRITKQWQHIGFQGEDPKTDFRGMGLLGLENLLYFAAEYPQAATHVLSHSWHPKHGYTFAIVGINLTAMAYYLLKNGQAKTYIFNSTQRFANIDLFHKFYCYLFYEFDKLWLASKPQTMMEFSEIFQKFEDSIKDQLADPSTVFRINLHIDNV